MGCINSDAERFIDDLISFLLSKLINIDIPKAYENISWICPPIKPSLPLIVVFNENRIIINIGRFKFLPSKTKFNINRK